MFYLSFFLLGLLCSVLSARGDDPPSVDPLAGGINIRHDDPAIKYSNRTAASSADCLQEATLCQNTWWTRPNPRKNQPHEAFAEESVTLGPQVGFTMKFTGSSAIELEGQREVGVHATATLNGRSYEMTQLLLPALLRANGLDKATTYTFEVQYHGSGFFAITAIGLERGATAGDAAGDSPVTPAPSDPPAGSVPSTDVPPPLTAADPQNPPPTPTTDPEQQPQPPAPDSSTEPPSGKALPPAGGPQSPAATTDSSDSPGPSSDTTDINSAPKTLAGNVFVACVAVVLSAVL
ncbi:hypothetical protein EXIGLDRAFT_776150 [Exidia glandulosa HHB12029]|uniref:Uncharacterized protein n=1 Tax=Exidia glandulosa HHB12029 TaxID=1314781 RepID=A0A165DLJ1_EXIGL|nr:hypothetical protein EXIGLDRAFT_776150 [Exidia glandulosa HHB12029]